MWQEMEDKEKEGMNETYRLQKILFIIREVSLCSREYLIHLQLIKMKRINVCHNRDVYIITFIHYLLISIIKYLDQGTFKKYFS